MLLVVCICKAEKLLTFLSQRGTQEHVGKQRVIWVERVFAEVGLPFWLGAILVSSGPITILLEIDTLLAPGIVAPFDSLAFLNSVIVFSALGTYLVAGMHIISTKVTGLREYARSMNLESGAVSTSSRRGAIGILLIWAIAISAFAVIGGFPTSIAELATDHVPATVYFLFILSSFVWAYGVSMLTIYKMGNLPLNLRPYAEDRTLGLRPFGVASLQLTGVYITLPVALALVSAVSSANLIDLLLVTSLTLTGLVLFFLPLLSFHRKLREAKRAELRWITPRYSRLVDRLKNEPDGPSAGQDREASANELLMVRSVQQDIRQIPEWPIDITILTRLVTVLALPPILGVVARLLILTVLHI